MKPSAILLLFPIAFTLISCGGSSETKEQEISEPQFTITTTVGEGGAISPQQATVTKNETTTFELTPQSEFLISSVSGCNGVLTENTYTVSNIESNCQISTSFVKKRYEVTTTQSTGGSITPNRIEISSGDTTTFNVITNTGYIIKTISGCDGQLSNGQFTTSAILSNCTVSVNFEEDKLAPTASILFPWKTSRIDKNTILVKGTAKDSSDISSIKVNGKSATITPIQTETLNNGEQLVHWEAKISAKQVKTDINIATEDALGNANSHADSVITYNYQIPMNFTIDQAKQLLFGSDGHNSLVKVNLLTKEVTNLSTDSPTNNTFFDVNTKFAYVEDINSLLYISIFSGQFNINALNVNTGTISTLLSQPMVESAYFRGLDYVSADNSIYINLDPVGVQGSTILKFSLDNQQLSTLVDRHQPTNPQINTRDIAYTPNGFIGFSANGLFNLALDGTAYQPFSTNFSLFMNLIETDANNNFIYTVGPYGIFKFNLTTQMKEAEFLDEDATDLLFGQPRSVAHYQDQNLLLIGDSDIDTIIAINTTTGARSNFISNGIGEGKKITEGRAIALDQENNQLYLLDGGYDNGELVILIDLANGNRTVVSDIDRHIARGDWVRDIILDKQANMLYLSSEDAIIRVNLQTEQSAILSNANTGTGEVIGFIGNSILDKENNRLMVTDTSSANLIAVDLTTGNRSIIAELSNIAQGRDLGVFYVEYDKIEQIAFILSRELGEFYQVNLNTMEQSLLLDQCVDTAQKNHLFGSSSNHIQLHLNTQTRQLLMTSDSFLKFDIDQGICTASSSRLTSFDAVLTDRNQIIATGNNRIVQQDFESGEKVIISK